jgi:hypothetical protein
MVPGLVRNLDFALGLEDGLFAPTATFDVFPLDDAVGVQRHGDCDYGSAAITKDEAGRLYRYLAHIAEGVDAVAENEFQCLSNSTFDVTPRPDGGGRSTDIIAPNLTLIHASSLTNKDFDLVAARGAMVVWSPRSNMFLYGRTLNVTYHLEAGITVALGTDWLPSGSATMGREAVCAREVMLKGYDIELASQDLWYIMTINAATVAGLNINLDRWTSANWLILSCSLAMTRKETHSLKLYMLLQRIWNWFYVEIRFWLLARDWRTSQLMGARMSNRVADKRLSVLRTLSTRSLQSSRLYLVAFILLFYLASQTTSRLGSLRDRTD